MKIKHFSCDYTDKTEFPHSSTKESSRSINRDSLYASDQWFYKTNPKADLKHNKGTSSIFLEKYIYSNIKNFNTALDIGARVGEWSRPLGMKFKKVISFEPRIYWCRSFVKNVKLDNVDIYNYGLGSDFSLANMRGSKVISLVDSERDRDDTTVSLAPLDFFNFKKIDFIKIDTNGHELEVLIGAKKTILKNKPLIFIESIERKPYFNGKTHVDHCLFLESLGMVRIEKFMQESKNRLHDSLYAWKSDVQ
tara:strand:+ start:1013 stop:1762 length:750 start_codon:yes stop_codon:yes gene_type:complete